MFDSRHRPVRDLRISVTDRCNFRCAYCMPAEIFGPGHAFLPRTELLSVAETVRLAERFVAAGVTKIRITGGEPLLRPELPELVTALARIEGVEDLALTTNGSRLFSHAARLASAGLSRVTVSLDALDDATFTAMNGVRFPVARVLGGIAAAEAAGLGPVKINMVVRRGINDHAVLEMAEHFRTHGQILRFIEFMDVGATNRWRLDEVVPSREIRDRIHARWPLEPVGAAYPGEVAQRYAYADGAGEIGLISSVSQPFCGACTRARLSADGQLFTCLFSGAGHDLRGPLRAGASEAELSAVIDRIWGARTDRYSELRSVDDAATDAVTDRSERVEMSFIGG